MKNTTNNLTLRKRLLVIAFIIVAVIFSIFAITQLLKINQKSKHTDLYSKVDEYNTQEAQVAKKTNWQDASSIKSGLLEMQGILDAKAPYLDSLTKLFNRSLSQLRPKDTLRSSDTLALIEWHEAYLKSLACQKRAQELTDSICLLFKPTNDSTQVETKRSELAQELTELFSNDSAVTATAMIEDSLRQIIGTMQMPD